MTIIIITELQRFIIKSDELMYCMYCLGMHMLTDLITH